MASTSWIGWEEAPPIWGCGWAATTVWFLYGFSYDLRVLFREANWDRASRGREANVRGDKFDEWYNFWFIYKTCLIGNQNPLKLHQWSRLKKILNGGFRFKGTVPPLFGGGGYGRMTPFFKQSVFFHWWLSVSLSNAIN